MSSFEHEGRADATHTDLFHNIGNEGRAHNDNANDLCTWCRSG